MSVRPKAVKSEAAIIEAATPEQKECLDPSHLLQIECISRDIEIARMQRQLKEQEVKMRMLEQKIGGFELSDLQRQLVQETTNYENKKKIRNSFIASIKDIYSISDTFGYSPDTGIIARG